ncbi:winged helix-turn-helix domain-containing protein [Salinigranum marinum]|uniref:winged helix-turn-helix domain-containing protein n=1 Tax=Salinigranum marinum TaxID=1515595 RepID=UPI002989FB4B|nr:winged helix-turn-helix domain-containing protein [Salinigranum marinum]
MTDDRPAEVNERVTEEWKSETTPGERVRTVIKRTYDPQSVAAIAERALTSETTARKHLGILAEDGYVEAVSLRDKRGTWYKRAPRSVVLERAQQILNSVDVDTLAERISELSETVREYEERAGAESPRAAAIDDSGLSAEEVIEWQTARRNLKLARAALALADATEAIDDDTGSGERGEPAGITG